MMKQLQSVVRAPYLSLRYPVGSSKIYVVIFSTDISRPTAVKERPHFINKVTINGSKNFKFFKKPYKQKRTINVLEHVIIVRARRCCSSINNSCLVEKENKVQCQIRWVENSLFMRWIHPTQTMNYELLLSHCYHCYYSYYWNYEQSLSHCYQCYSSYWNGWATSIAFLSVLLFLLKLRCYFYRIVISVITHIEMVELLLYRIVISVILLFITTPVLLPY